MAGRSATAARWGSRAARILLALVFLAAGLAKAGAPDEFTLAVWNFRLLPWQASAAVAHILPGVEITLGVWLLTPWWPRAALGAAIGLLAAFTAALASAGARGLDVACGCFGPEASPDAGASLALAVTRNLALMTLAVGSGIAMRAAARHPEGGHDD